MTLAWSMDQIGTICRTVEDCAIVLDAIRGIDPSDRTTVILPFNFQANHGLTGLKVGYIDGTVSSADLNTLSLLGATPVPVTFPTFPSGALLSIMAVEAAAAFDDFTRSGNLDLLSSQGAYDLPSLIRTARTVSAVDYVQADRVRMKVIESVANFFRDVDLLVTSNGLDSNLVAGHLVGLPCVTVPHGNGTSFVFIGRLYDDAAVLEAAKAYQDATGYHLEHPPMFTN